MPQDVLDRDAIEQMTFGETLRALRKRKGWSIQRLSNETEIDVAYVSRLENGKKDNPTGPLLGCIADALGLDGAERFLFFCKALEAKYGRPYIFGREKEEDANRVYEAVQTAFGYGRRLFGSLLRAIRGASGRA